MSKTTVASTGIDLSDNFAFTGTITGTPSDAVLVSSSTGGGATTQAINGCFSSTYKYYMILANITMSGNAQVFFRFQDSSNNALSASVYYYQGYRSSNPSGSIALAALGSFGNDACTTGLEILSASNRFGMYRIFVHDPFSSSSKTNYSQLYSCQSSSSEFRTAETAGVYDTETSMTGIRFISANSSTIGSASSFKVYGLK